MSISLTQNQSMTVLENICKLRNLKKPKEIFSGKPRWDDETIEKYKYEKFARFADNYRIFIADGKDKSKNECFIVVDISKSFEKYVVFACANLLHLFIDHIDTSSKRPIVSICFTTSVSPKQLAELNIKIFPFSYRFMIFTELYFLCGSRTKIGGLTGDYEILPYEPTYNGKEYALINSNDPLVIAMNGIPGDLLKYYQLMYDNGVYKTIFIKKVQKIAKNPELSIDALHEDLIIE